MKKLILPSLAILSLATAGTVFPVSAQAQTENTPDAVPVFETTELPEMPADSASSQGQDIPADIQIVTPPPATEKDGGQPAAQPESVISVTDVPPDAPAPINPDIAVAPPAGQSPVDAATVLEPVLGTPVEKEINEQIMFQSPEVDVNLIPSLFFSKWEHDLIIDARNTLNTRPPEDGSTEPAIVIESPRDVILGGIVYVSSKEWTIWVNQRRVTPDSIPSEVMDLKVFKDYIQLEWFDAQTNQIFPIRLRTHQRFNLDTRMFLPG